MNSASSVMTLRLPFDLKHKIDLMAEKQGVSINQLAMYAFSKEIAELEAAAHRQGFASLAEVERAILEPGGVFLFIGKDPSAEVLRYRELIGRMDQLSGDIAALRAAQKSDRS